MPDRRGFFPFFAPVEHGKLGQSDIRELSKRLFVQWSQHWHDDVCSSHVINIHRERELVGYGKFFGGSQREFFERVKVVHCVTARSLCYFQRSFAEQVGFHFRLRTISPDVAVVRLHDLKLDIDVVIKIVRRHGIHLGDLSHVKTHEHDGITHAQSGGPVNHCVVGDTFFEPALTLCCVVQVITKPRKQQHRRHDHEPAHRALHAIETRAQLRG